MTCKTHPDAPHGFVRGASHSEDRYVCECEFWEEPKMNERIKLLALQAGSTHKQNLGVYQFYTDELEKFAKLIVRECIRVPYDMWDKAELNADIAVKIEHRIKEHFGVEE